jgi:hypothetical protein
MSNPDNSSVKMQGIKQQKYNDGNIKYKQQFREKGI